MASKILEFIIRAKDSFSSTLGSAKNSFKSMDEQSRQTKAGIDWAAHATGGMSKQAKNLRSSQDEANRAMMAAMQAGVGLRNILNGGAGALGGAAQMVRALTKELKILATTDIKKLGFASIGPIVAAAAVGFKAGSMLDEQFDISTKVAGWIVKPVEFAVARSYESFNKLDQVKLDGLKKEIQSISDALEDVIKQSDRALARSLSLLGAQTGKQLEDAQSIADPVKKAERVAEIQKESKDEELALRQKANDEKTTVAQVAQQEITNKMTALKAERERLWKANELAVKQGEIAHSKGTLDKDSPILLRVKETRAQAQSFEGTFNPEIEKLTKIKDDLAQQIQDLANESLVIKLETDTNATKFSNALSTAAGDKVAKDAKDQAEMVDIWKKADEVAKEQVQKAAVERNEKDLNKKLEANAADINQAQGGIGAAQSRMQKADAAVNQAWGWVKDPQAFRAQLKSEKEEVKFQRKFEREAERLQGMQDWRTKKLSDKDEAVRRMLLAKEEKQAAEDQLQKIERHVANLQQIRIDLQDNLKRG